MATTIDVQIKQDSILLKELVTPPETGLGESVLFLDSFSKEIKYREEENGLVKSISKQDIPVVTREILGAAASGSNTDITSLGTLTSTTLIQGTLSFPQYSFFTAYHPTDQPLANRENYNPLVMSTVKNDKLAEFSNSKFVVSRSGVYLLSAAISVRIEIARPDWRIILAFYVNGVERSRGNDLSINGLYGGTSGTALLPLNAGDYVELFLYTQYSCIVFGGEAVTRMSGCRIA